MTPLDLEAIEKRANDATPGPWKHCCEHCSVIFGSDGNTTVHIGPSFDEADFVPGRDGQIADAEFISNARTDIPALLAEVARLQGERDAAVKQLNDNINRVPVDIGTRKLETISALRSRFDAAQIHTDKLLQTLVLLETFWDDDNGQKSKEVIPVLWECAKAIDASLTAPANESGVGK